MVLSSDAPETPTHFFVREFLIGDGSHQTPNELEDGSSFAERAPSIVRGQFFYIPLMKTETSSGRYTVDELECWSQRGDQIAAFLAYGMGAASMSVEMNVGEQIDVRLQNRGRHLLRAVEPRSDVCLAEQILVGLNSEHCLPETMLATYPNGLPLALRAVSEILLESNRFRDPDASLDALRRAGEGGLASAWYEYLAIVDPGGAPQPMPGPH